jgi:hypothetical protein
MKTTIELSDDLAQKAKQLAARRGVTLRAVKVGPPGPLRGSDKGACRDRWCMTLGSPRNASPAVSEHS